MALTRWMSIGHFAELSEDELRELVKQDHTADRTSHAIGIRETLDTDSELLFLISPGFDVKTRGEALKVLRVAHFKACGHKNTKDLTELEQAVEQFIWTQIQ